MKLIIMIILILVFCIFIMTSYVTKFQPGQDILKIFITFLIKMIKILPCAFILIGLFEVWVKKETIEKHLGKENKFTGYIWAILLASATAGTIIVAMPIAQSLAKKGARLSIILTFLGAAGICRIPMTLFEISYIGIKFSIIRLITSIILVIFSSIILEFYLEKTGYKIKK